VCGTVCVSYNVLCPAATLASASGFLMAQENIKKVRDSEGPRVAQDAVEDSGGTVTSDFCVTVPVRRPPPAARRTRRPPRAAAVPLGPVGPGLAGSSRDIDIDVT